MKQYALKTGIAGVLVAVALAGLCNSPAQADVFELKENDNQVAFYDPVNQPDRGTLDIIAYNNSDDQGPPHDTAIPEIPIYDLFSVNTPTLGNLPDFWNGNVYAGTEDNLWKIIFNTNDSFSYLGSGSDKVFQIHLFKSPGESFTMGDVYGQGRFEAWGLEPSSPGASFQGTTGQTPEPCTIALLGLGGLALLTRRTRSL